MINMFKIIDDTFIDLWNRVHNTHASAAWITQVQTQLSADSHNSTMVAVTGMAAECLPGASE
jgi:hypothetical protein